MIGAAARNRGVRADAALAGEVLALLGERVMSANGLQRLLHRRRATVAAVLAALEAEGRVVRTGRGWRIAP
jgi:predicted Rossmann fold nucleotide-binding protein DprA/Smf involved in DNA uptake